MINERTPKPYNGNPFGLVYGGALTENRAGCVQIHPVTYDLGPFLVSANIYTPADYNDQGKYAGIVVSHPNGAVKEQASGLYAQKLAECGFVTLAFDAVFTGESSGDPRGIDVPYFRIEDIRRAADILSLYPGVDENRIGLLGVCGGGGYALAAAQGDKRFKTIATVSAFNTGSARRLGFSKAQKDSVISRLHDVADLRAKEIREGTLSFSSDMAALPKDVMMNNPVDMYREGYEYYVLTHPHPNAHAAYALRNQMDLMLWDCNDYMHLIDQPLLMIIGDKADSAYMSEEVFEKATGTAQKELFRIPDTTHIQTYWKPEAVSAAMEKLNQFFSETL